MFGNLRSDLDTRRVGDGSGASVPDLAIRAKAKSFIEAPLGVFEKVDGSWEEIPGHQLARLWSRPNPYSTGRLMGGLHIRQVVAAGTSYALKDRSAAGLPVRLWPMRSDLVEPLAWNDVTPQQLADLGRERGEQLVGWRYTVAGETRLYRVEDVLVLKEEDDPNDFRIGLSPLKAQLKEVLTDEEAAVFTGALLKNMAIPGVILTPASEPGPSPDEADDMVEAFKDKWGGAGRGEPMVVSGGPMNVEVVSFSPEQMNLDKLRMIPESRISAAIGVTPQYAGLMVGVDSTFANWREAREAQTEDHTAPIWGTFGELITHSLGPDFGLTESQAARFDISEVRSLQEDRNEQMDRLNRGVQGGWITREEARLQIGMPAEAEGEFLMPFNVVAVPAGEQEPPDPVAA